VVMVSVLGVTDFFTGFEVSFSIFYLIPISFAVFFTDFKFGLAVSILSAVSWYLADVNGGHSYSNFMIPIWNSVMRFLYFILHSYLLSRFLRLYERLKVKAVTDTLTQAVNATQFFILAERELHNAVRSRKPFTMAYLDLDNFKQLNDTFGHLQGDDALRTVSHVIKESIRPADVFGRMGGDEFALLFPETDFRRATGRSFCLAAAGKERPSTASRHRLSSSSGFSLCFRFISSKI
jgi:diguanylate cyclase (GGDEF)-like protein